MTVIMRFFIYPSSFFFHVYNTKKQHKKFFNQNQTVKVTPKFYADSQYPCV